ncbi:MAG: glutaredoxin [Bacteroidetes bacterium]|nr:MAG: glutaredoxin [Bacteroidota bacterium]
MSLFNEQVKGQLKDLLGNMQDDVYLAFFTREDGCQTCADTQTFLEEIASLSPRLTLVRYDYDRDTEAVATYHIDKTPAIALLDANQEDTRIRFYGIPAGYEINSFVGALVEVSGNRQPLPDELKARIEALDKDIHLQVFITLSCPHCPGAVMAAHRLALESKRITADMVEASTFMELSQQHQVMGVPHTVINDKGQLVGARPLEALLQELERV